MAKYTLKSFCGDKLIERFEHRTSSSLKSILVHPRFHRAGETGPWGEALNNPDRFEIFDNQMEKISNGNINDTLALLKTLR